MEDLLRRVRSRVSGKEEIGSFREGRTPPQRTPSFRGERKPEKWLKRQFSRQMSYNHSMEEAEYAAAVAAAAFAITSLDSDVVDQRKPEPERRPSLPRVISGLIGSAFSSEPDKPQKYYSDENDDEAARMAPEKTIHPVPSIKRNPSMPKKRLTFADELAEDPNKPSTYDTPHFSEEDWKEVDKMKPVSTPSFRRTPSAKKAPSFSENEFEDAQRMNPVSNTSFKRTPTVKKTPSFNEEVEELRRIKTPKRPAQQPILPPPPPAVPPLNIQPIAPPKRAHQPQDQENDADVWEIEQMAKIKQRYEKLNETIMDWEDKKKKKARRKLEMTERDPEKKRVKAMHNYQMEMERIRQIAEGARAQAKDKRRNEEMKVREKASRYRATGETPQPPTCLCL